MTVSFISFFNSNCLKFKQILFVLDAPGAGYTDILLTPEQYISKPHVDQEIERQHFSGAELLKRGTTILYSGQKVVSPLLAEETEENDIKNASKTTGLISENIQIANSRYAMGTPYNEHTYITSPSQ